MVNAATRVLRMWQETRWFVAEENSIGAKPDQPVVTNETTIQTSDGWAVCYRQNDELRKRANIQHRRLKKVRRRRIVCGANLQSTSH